MQQQKKVASGGWPVFASVATTRQASGKWQVTLGAGGTFDRINRINRMNRAIPGQITDNSLPTLSLSKHLQQ
jgi:hypothetical protein